MEYDQSSDQTYIFPRSEVIAYSEDPTTSQWQLVPLYGTSSLGKRQLWQIGFQALDDRTGQLVIIHGYVDGKKQTDRRSVVPKSTRTLQEQALLEARHRYHNKYHDGYRPIDEPTHRSSSSSRSPDHPGQKPMLAFKYAPPWKQDKASDERRLTRFPVAVQAKLDGVRSLIQRPADGVVLKSRTGRLQHNLDHIRKDLNVFFDYLPAGVVLDGELYAHDMSFNEVVSAVRTETHPHPRSGEIVYHIFDLILDEPFERRYERLVRAYRQYIDDHDANNPSFVLLSITLAHNHDEIEAYYRQYIEAGFEGLMIKKLAGSSPTEYKESLYRSGKCAHILKYKHFIDEEGIIVGVKEGTGREKGHAILMIRDQNDRTFPVRPRGSFEQRAKWFQDPEAIIGKTYTFRYFERTPDGVPRFPTGVAIRDYE